MKKTRLFLVTAMILFIGACATQTVSDKTSNKDSSQAPSANKGKYYLDDGPPADGGIALTDIPDAVPQSEKINPAHNRPYTALGKSYKPYKQLRPYRQEGLASWYGRRYHGRKTSSGEVYNMFKMTGAHPFLAIPSYVRVTRTDNGKSVVIRINDRGPFWEGRIVDLSYAAAHRLGYVKDGTTKVIVEAIIPNGVAHTQPQRAGDDNEEKIPAVAASPFIQLGAFQNKNGAETTRQNIITQTGKKAKIKKSGDLYIIYTGTYANHEEAQKTMLELCDIGWCGIIK